MFEQRCRRCDKLIVVPDKSIATEIAKACDFSFCLHKNIFGVATPEVTLCKECKDSLRQWYLSGKENFNASSNSI